MIYASENMTDVGAFVYAFSSYSPGIKTKGLAPVKVW